MRRYLIEIIIIVIILANYGIAAYQRNFIWKDDFSLWDDVVEKSPNKARGYNVIGMWHVNLGIAYWKKGLHELANKEIGLGKALRRRHETRIVEHGEGYHLP